jgi:hypothetical protein
MPQPDNGADRIKEAQARISALLDQKAVKEAELKEIERDLEDAKKRAKAIFSGDPEARAEINRQKAEHDRRRHLIDEVVNG